MPTSLLFLHYISFLQYVQLNLLQSEANFFPLFFHLHPQIMENSQPKIVQEMASKGGEIPENYIYKDDHDGGAPDAPMMGNNPAIDLGLLGSSSDELEKLKSALTTWGVFQVTNHGMKPEFLNQVRDITKQFFHLPLEEKLKYFTQDSVEGGYGNDSFLAKQKKLDWMDRLILVIHPEDHRNLKLWPENPKDFRSILHEYSLKVKWISEVILKAMARSLHLEENCFVGQYGEGSKLYARLNLYPKCPRPDLVLGTKPHTDGLAITLLLQDDSVEGLQILKDERWYKVPVIPEALLVNVGDQAEISSNGIFKSPVHRVVTNAEKERISLAVFYTPDPDKDIEPLEGLIDESRPKLYKKIQNYFYIYFQYHQQGKTPLDAAKIDV